MGHTQRKHVRVGLKFIQERKSARNPIDKLINTINGQELNYPN